MGKDREPGIEKRILHSPTPDGGIRRTIDMSAPITSTGPVDVEGILGDIKSASRKPARSMKGSRFGGQRR